jgi:hypothetical protein
MNAVIEEPRSVVMTNQSEQTMRIGAGCGGDVGCRFTTQFGNATQDLGDSCRFVALALMGCVGLVRGVALQQQKLDRHLGHDAAQPLRTRISHRAANAEIKTDLPQLPCLLLAAGKAVHHATQTAGAAQSKAYLFQCAARVHDYRQVPLLRQPELAQEVMPLEVMVKAVHMEIQADLADRHRMAPIEPFRQCIDVRRKMIAQKHRMQAESGMQLGMVGAQCLDPRPAVDIDGRYDHGVDTGPAGAFDHRIAIDRERVVIEMDMAVDQLGREAIFVHWE